MTLTLLLNELKRMCVQAKEQGINVIEVRTLWIAKKLERIGVPIKAVNPMWRGVECVRRKKRGVVEVDCDCLTS